MAFVIVTSLMPTVMLASATDIPDFRLQLKLVISNELIVLESQGKQCNLTFEKVTKEIAFKYCDDLFSAHRGVLMQPPKYQDAFPSTGRFAIVNVSLADRGEWSRLVHLIRSTYCDANDKCKSTLTPIRALAFAVLEIYHKNF